MRSRSNPALQCMLKSCKRVYEVRIVRRYQRALPTPFLFARPSTPRHRRAPLPPLATPSIPPSSPESLPPPPPSTPAPSALRISLLWCLISAVLLAFWITCRGEPERAEQDCSGVPYLCRSPWSALSWPGPTRTPTAIISSDYTTIRGPLSMSPLV